jgi:hypothetical protein
MLQKLDAIEYSDGVCQYRPRGRYSLVDAVDLISRAIAHCRDRGVSRLLIDASGFEDLPIPSLVDRFLMVEDWAQAAKEPSWPCWWCKPSISIRESSA